MLQIPEYLKELGITSLQSWKTAEEKKNIIKLRGGQWIMNERLIEILGHQKREKKPINEREKKRIHDLIHANTMHCLLLIVW